MRKTAFIFALLSGVACASAAFAQAPDAAEEAMWSTIKNTSNAAEVRAFIQAYPNGLYSQLARLRLDELTQTAAAPPATTAPPAMTAPPTTQATAPRPQTAQTPTPPPTLESARPSQQTGGNMSAAVIKEVQERLWALNYDPGKATGIINDETTKAIKEWQKQVGFPESGVVSEDQLKRLREARIPSQWGSIAYTNTGAYGWVVGRPSRAKAEEDAIANCDKNAKGADCSDPITASGSWCISLATYSTRKDGQNLTGARVSSRSTMAEATNAAMTACKSAQNSGGNCQSRVTICADGSHAKK